MASDSTLGGFVPYVGVRLDRTWLRNVLVSVTPSCLSCSSRLLLSLTSVFHLSRPFVRSVLLFHAVRLCLPRLSTSFFCRRSDASLPIYRGNLICRIIHTHICGCFRKRSCLTFCREARLISEPLLTDLFEFASKSSCVAKVNQTIDYKCFLKSTFVFSSFPKPTKTNKWHLFKV